MTNYDDDLFDYDPSTEEKASPPSYEEKVTPLSKEEQSFFSEIKDNFDNDSQMFGNLNGSNIAFADSFQTTLNNFVGSQTRTPSFIKSVTESLDELTGGKFSLIHFKNHLETTIARSMHVLYLTSFLNKDSPFDEASEPIQEILNILDLTFDSFYLKTCFHSTLAILQHKLILDRELYKAACSELNIQPDSSLFIEPSEFVDSEHADSFENSSYQKEKFSKINTYLYESTDLIQSISELFVGRNVSF
jgi:hypothetical protein